jgi:hypothetical protein
MAGMGTDKLCLRKAQIHFSCGTTIEADFCRRRIFLQAKTRRLSCFKSENQSQNWKVPEERNIGAESAKDDAQRKTLDKTQDKLKLSYVPFRNVPSCSYKYIGL